MMDMEKNESSLPESVSRPRVRRHAVSLVAGLIGIAVVAGMVLSGCSSKEPAEEAPTVTVQVGAAESEPIQRVISADAILYPKDQAAISPKVSAPVAKFYVDRGSKVRAGQLLAELENKDLAGAVTENQGGYQEAEANYQTISQKSGQDLKLAKEQLDAAQKLYDARESLFKQGAASARDVQDARIALTQAQDQYTLAEKQYELKSAEAQLTAAKGRTTSAEAQLSYTKIVSPINGVVTDRPLYAGETAPAGSPLITVMDLSQVVARAHIPQSDAAQLKAGDAATVALPGQKAVPGKVTLVSPALDPGSTTVEVWVQAPNPGDAMRPGASVRVSMVAETVPKAVVIPAEALLTATDGTTSVIVLDSDNKPHKQKITTGIRNGDDVQVTEGLKGGERLVTVGAFELANEDEDVLPKTKIQVQAPKMPDEDDDDN
jgi:HlyD family secretion protein